MRAVLICVTALAVVSSTRVRAQYVPTQGVIPRVHVITADEDNRSGPRFGAAAIIGGSETAEQMGRSFFPITSLFGWQFERQFSTGKSDAPTPMTELIVLAGGLEQGILLPSVSWMLGVRQPNGWEAGVGPTATGAGVQLAFAAGVTHTIGNVNVPLNFAVVPGRRGAAISITSGFNTRH